MALRLNVSMFPAPWTGKGWFFWGTPKDALFKQTKTHGLILGAARSKRPRVEQDVALKETYGI